MAIRICPQCMARLSPGKVAASSDEVECPSCGKHLEVSFASRMVATVLGLMAAAVVWRITGRIVSAEGTLSWVLPMVYAVLAWSIVSTLFLMLTADLRIKPAQITADRIPTAVVR